MAVKTLKMSARDIQELYKKTKPFSIRETKPQYTSWQLKTEGGLVITAYTSGKVVFQGDEADMPADPGQPANKETESGRSPVLKNRQADLRSALYPMAGSDETGNGDFFGPITCAAVIVENEETAERLKKMKITDSKAMTDDYIRKIAPEIEKMVPYSAVVLKNSQYNEVRRQIPNIKSIVARLHNQCYLNLIRKGYRLPENIVIDQFCAPSSYYRYLSGSDETVRNIHFETKAESKYIAVAAASVIARYHLLLAFDALEKKYGIHFNKGAGKPADLSGKEFLKSYPASELKNCAKLHFKNMEKIGASGFRTE